MRCRTECATSSCCSSESASHQFRNSSVNSTSHATPTVCHIQNTPGLARPSVENAIRLDARQTVGPLPKFERQPGDVLQFRRYRWFSRGMRKRIVSDVYKRQTLGKRRVSRSRIAWPSDSAGGGGDSTVRAAGAGYLARAMRNASVLEAIMETQVTRTTGRDLTAHSPAGTWRSRRPPGKVSVFHRD